MRSIVILIIILFNNTCFAQKELSCLKNIKKSNWNYAICTDSIMDVNLANMSEILIKQQEISDSGKLTRQLSIRMLYNYKNKSVKELWSSEFEDIKFKESKLVSATDSLFKVNDNSFYSKHIVYKDEKDKIWTLSSAIGIYKSQYYSFHTMGINKGNDSYKYLLKVINRSNFFDTPTLKNDNKIRDSFLDNLIKSITNEKSLNEILLDVNTFISIAPEEEKQILEKDHPKIELMINSWNKSVYPFIKEMKEFETVSIKNSSFIPDNPQPNATTYFIRVLFNCDQQEISYKMLCMAIDGKIYLGQMMKS